MKRFSPLAFTLLAFVSSAYAQFTFTSIDFPGGTLTMARGINNHGEIVGAYRIVQPRHALLIKDGQYIPLAPTTILEPRLINHVENSSGMFFPNFAASPPSASIFL